MVAKVKILALSFCMFASANAKAGDPILNKHKISPAEYFDATELFKVNAVLSEAFQHMNTPYRSGGKTPAGFDCSGFVHYCFGTALAKSMPASSRDYDTFGMNIAVADCRPGDIICFKGHQIFSNRIGHVGIVTEVSKNDIYFIHSANHGGIRIDRMNSKYYADRMVGIRRVTL